MKRAGYCAFYLFIACILISCTLSNQGTARDDELIKPGDKIGEMTVEQGSIVPYPYIWKFCKDMPDEHEPFTFTSECDVPMLSGLDIVFGWFAKETKFTSNWDAMTWELSRARSFERLTQSKESEVNILFHFERGLH